MHPAGAPKGLDVMLSGIRGNHSRLRKALENAIGRAVDAHHTRMWPVDSPPTRAGERTIPPLSRCGGPRIASLRAMRQANRWYTACASPVRKCCMYVAAPGSLHHVVCTMPVVASSHEPAGFIAVRPAVAAAAVWVLHMVHHVKLYASCTMSSNCQASWSSRLLMHTIHAGGQLTRPPWEQESAPSPP